MEETNTSVRQSRFTINDYFNYYFKKTKESKYGEEESPKDNMELISQSYSKMFEGAFKDEKCYGKNFIRKQTPTQFDTTYQQMNSLGLNSSANYNNNSTGYENVFPKEPSHLRTSTNIKQNCNNNSQNYSHQENEFASMESNNDLVKYLNESILNFNRICQQICVSDKYQISIAESREELSRNKNAFQLNNYNHNQKTRVNNNNLNENVNYSRVRYRPLPLDKGNKNKFNLCL